MTIEPPWSDEQVESLKMRQENIEFHPYTHTCGGILVPTPLGWVCPACSGTQIVQSWCHSFDCLIPIHNLPDKCMVCTASGLQDGPCCPPKIKEI